MDGQSPDKYNDLVFEDSYLIWDLVSRTFGANEHSHLTKPKKHHHSLQAELEKGKNTTTISTPSPRPS